MALGASARDVMWLVLRQSLKMIAVGVGWACSRLWRQGRLLRHLVEGMGPVNAATYVMMISLLVLAALLASFVPALRASLIDPVKALRQE